MAALVAALFCAVCVPAMAGNHVCHTRACVLRVAAKHKRADARWCQRHRACRARVAYRRALRRVAPYRGPHGTRWAIPWYVIACESHGNWDAYNPSGAAGPYQLMPMWGAPYPARTRAQKLANHRIAARLWAGGSGAHNWECA